MKMRLLALSPVALVLLLGSSMRFGGAAGDAIDFESSPRPKKPADAGVDGLFTIHGDAASSGTTPLPGPGNKQVKIQRRRFLAACPTILIRSDGMPLVLSMSYFGRVPVVRLLDKQTGRQKAKLRLSRGGSLLGDVYAFLDNEDRIVVIDGNSQALFRIKALQTIPWLGFLSPWKLVIDEKIELMETITEPCGGVDKCDLMVSISPGRDGVIWFLTEHALVGTYDPMDGKIRTLQLGEQGEQVSNTFSTTADGFAAVVTAQALYGLQQQQDQNGSIQLLWREPYDEGSTRKPGNLGPGSGTTPSIFGPVQGNEFVSITDNADERISVVVRSTSDGALVCQIPIFSTSNSGTENSQIAIGRYIVTSSTYGYVYPILPEEAGPSFPETAEFVGGMVMVDVETCQVVWENQERSTTVPKLSTHDGLIYTTTFGDDSSSKVFFFTVIDPQTGATLRKRYLSYGFFGDTLQMAGNIGTDGVFWQGDSDGLSRISPS